MAQNPKDPFQSRGKITFFMNPDTNTFDKSFYNPSMTDNKIDTDEINTVLSQIDYVYREHKRVQSGAFIFPLFPILFIAAYAKQQNLTLRQVGPVTLGLSVLSAAGLGFFTWKNGIRRAEKEAKELMNQANRIYVPIGFRWNLPNAFEKVELCSDYKYWTSKKAINDDN